MKITAPTGQGLGVQKFSIDPNGGGLILGDSAPSNPATTPIAAPATPVETPTETPIEPPTTEVSPFNRLHPGVDPSKVEMVLDDRTGKLKFREIEAPPVIETPEQVQATSPVIETPNEVTQLRAQLEQQNQLVQAMLVAQAQGKPLGEVLGITQPQTQEPDYSQYDLYDEGQRAEFVRQLRQDALSQARTEIQAALQPHLPALAGARQQQEYTAVYMKHGKDPDFNNKVAVTTQLVQGNPNVSFEATYNLVSQIQQSLGANGAPKTGAPQQVSPSNARQTTLTQEQAQAKAEQAQRFSQNSGVRGGGEPALPENIRSFREAVRWTAHQAALGNIKV